MENLMKTTRPNDPEEREDSVMVNEEDLFVRRKEEAKNLFLAKEYAAAYAAYEACIAICSFKDQIVTLCTNMAMCSIKLNKYEQAFFDCQRALEMCKGTDVDGTLQIKLKYRLALCLAHFRDYDGASNLLKHLKKYCNLQEQVDMFASSQKLHNKVAELQNQRDLCKFSGKTFGAGPNASEGQSFVENNQNIMGRIADYVSSKLEIGEVEGKGRCVTAVEKIKKGETLMVCMAVASSARKESESKASSLDKLVEQIWQTQAANPLTTSLMLNYLKGGPLQDQVMGNFEIFTRPLTDFLIAARQRGLHTFRLLEKDQIASIVRFNSFTSTGPLLKAHVITGQKNSEQKSAPVLSDNLYTMPSFLNHSCQPNAHRSFFREDSSVIFIKAVKDITEFEEVTISYTDLLQSVGEREQDTKVAWGFTCRCERCVLERDLESGGFYEPYKRLVALTAVDQLLKNSGLQTSNQDLAQALHENYFALEAKLEGCLAEKPGDSTVFNPYLAQTFMNVLYLLLPSNYEKLFPAHLDSSERHTTILEVFGSIQRFIWSYLTKFEQQYPQLLARALDHIYAFKASFSSEQSDRKSVYSLMEAWQEEQMFNKWEVLYQWVHPVDWYESSYVFNTMIRQVYDQRTDHAPVQSAEVQATEPKEQIESATAFEAPWINEDDDDLKFK